MNFGKSFDLLQESERTKRFIVKGIRPARDCAFFDVIAARRAQNDDGGGLRGVRFAELRADLEAVVCTGEMDIEKNDIGAPNIGLFKAARARPGTANIEASRRDESLNHATNRVGIFDDEYAQRSQSLAPALADGSVAQ